MIASHALPERSASRAAKRALGALSIGAAVLATGLLWAVSQALGVTLKVDFHHGTPPEVFGPALLLGFTLQVALLGWAALAVLEHFTQRAVQIWTGLGVGVLVLSFLPIALIGASADAKIVLSLTHVAVAAVVLTLLPRTAQLLRLEVTAVEE